MAPDRAPGTVQDGLRRGAAPGCIFAATRATGARRRGRSTARRGASSRSGSPPNASHGLRLTPRTRRHVGGTTTRARCLRHVGVGRASGAAARASLESPALERSSGWRMTRLGNGRCSSVDSRLASDARATATWEWDGLRWQRSEASGQRMITSRWTRPHSSRRRHARRRNVPDAPGEPGRSTVVRGSGVVIRTAPAVRPAGVRRRRQHAAVEVRHAAVERAWRFDGRGSADRLSR